MNGASSGVTRLDGLLVPLRSSWLRISRTRFGSVGCGNAAIPSSASGVMLPSDIVVPIAPNVV